MELIDLKNLKLQIDNYPARKKMGFYKIKDRAADIAEKGKETAESAAKFYAQSGDKLSKFKEYDISDLAEEILYTPQKEIQIIYKPGPTIDFKA